MGTRHVLHYLFISQIPENMAAATEKIAETAKGEVDTLADRDVDSTESDIRYMAYGARLRTALRASTLYIAYV